MYVPRTRFGIKLYLSWIYIYKRPWKTSSFPMKLRQNWWIWWKWINWWRFFMCHCVDIWNCRYLDFYQGPMTVYLPLHSTNFVSQFLLWSSIRICLQSSHYEDYHYIFLCCECQSLSMPNKACPKAQSFLVFKLFLHWVANYTRGRAFGGKFQIFTKCGTGKVYKKGISWKGQR